MKNDDIAGRMPGFKYETTSAFDDIGAMVDELAAAPPGHERANQIAQQIKSHLDRVGSRIGEMQPDDGSAPDRVVGKPVAGPAITDEGANFAGPQRTYESPVERQMALGERSNSAGVANEDRDNDPHYGEGSQASDAPEIVEMEKEVGGEHVQVTVWESCAHHLEADGWERVSDAREPEDGEHVVGDKDEAKAEAHAD